jgi:hypothetical protein
MGLGWLGSAVGGLIGGSLSNSASRHAMDSQIATNRYDYQHRYQWAMQDMQKAGLNPILAATQGIAGTVNGASALGASYNSIGGDLAAGAGADAASNSAKAQQKHADVADKLSFGQIKQMDSQIALNASSAKKLDEDTLSTHLANRLFNDSYNYQLDIYRQNLENSKKQGAYIDSQIANNQFMRDVVMPAQAFSYTAQGNASNSAADYNGKLGLLADRDYEYKGYRNKDYGTYGNADDGGLFSTLGRYGSRLVNSIFGN